MIQRIFEKLYYLRTTRYLRKLERKLNQASSFLVIAQKKIERIGDPKNYIPTNKIMAIQTQFDEIFIGYLESNHPEFMPSIAMPGYLIKRTDILIRHSNYLSFVKHFDAVKRDYLSLYRRVCAMHEDMSAKIENIAEQIRAFHYRIETMKESYISNSEMERVITDFQSPILFYENACDEDITDDSYVPFRTLHSQLPVLRKEWNKSFVMIEIERQRDFLSDIDGKSLDDQQRLAVITDEDHNLVLAGAGSGKTLTIAAKVKYLVEQKRVSPHHILLISFTRKAVREMQERITTKMNINVEAKTFHSLGMGVIQKARFKKTNVLDPDDNNIISNYLSDQILNQPSLIDKIVMFFGLYLNIPVDKTDLNSQGEYLDQTRSLDHVTLKGKVQELRDQKKTIKGEQVKSQEEVILANFLFLNGVKYTYEEPYKHNTADQYHRQYQPDFYLHDYDLYIEHFGITETNTVPWLSDIEAKKYLNGITWKRKTHAKYETKLIETYSYENKNGRLLEQFKAKLIQAGVKFEPVDYREIFDAIVNQEKSSYYLDFKKLMETFVGLFKSNGYEYQKFNEFRATSVQKHKNNPFLMERERLFFDIVDNVYSHYQDELLKQGVIDFNDMINDAREAVPLVSFPYRYIIVDEYQDISQSRFKLINEIKEKCGARLLCVGDDWQSIYRFAGSDLDLFTSFESYFGCTEVMRIEKTYRNSTELIDVAGAFIMQNPRQLRKQLRSDKRLAKPIHLMMFDRDNKVMAFRHTLSLLANRVPQHETVMVLGRNNSDIKWLIQEQPDFEYNEKTGVLKYSNEPMLKLDYLTVHKSKGMEASNVVLINADNKLAGFPNKISDDPLLQWVLTNADEMEFAEERRLFYVALTRTENHMYILGPQYGSSLFVTELLEHYFDFIHIDQTCLGDKETVPLPCPKCQTGALVVREGEKHKPFLGCSNYPRCDAMRDIRIKDEKVVCMGCGGYMVRRIKDGSEFYGCTNFPVCRTTMPITENERIPVGIKSSSRT